MKNKKQLIIAGCAIAAAVLIAVIAALGFGNADAGDPKPIENAAQRYTDATAALADQENFSYTVTGKKEVIISSEAFNELSLQHIVFENYGTNTFRGYVTEQLQVGEHQVSITETYADGTGYFTVESSRFSSAISEEDYISRYAPADPITPELYNGITGYKENNCTVIEFVQASDVEPWLQITDASFVSSDAAAYLDASGKLTKTVYNVSYSTEETFIRQSITIELTEQPSDPIQVPEGPFISIDNPDAPRMLEVACGYLLDPVSITASYKDNISCQVFGDLRRQTITIHAVNTDAWNSLTETQISMENTGNIGAISTLTRTELYVDGILKTVLNGEAETSEEQDEEIIKTRCQDTFVGTILLPQHITAVTVTEEPGAYRYEYTANETFSALLSAEASATLYQDTEILREHAQDYKTDTCTGYLTVSKTTGLPLSSGFSYVGIYTIDALPYRLEFSADQEYELLNDNANNAINKEAGA